MWAQVVRRWVPLVRARVRGLVPLVRAWAGGWVPRVTTGSSVGPVCQAWALGGSLVLGAGPTRQGTGPGGCQGVGPTCQGMGPHGGPTCQGGVQVGSRMSGEGPVWVPRVRRWVLRVRAWARGWVPRVKAGSRVGPACQGVGPRWVLHVRVWVQHDT